MSVRERRGGTLPPAGRRAARAAAFLVLLTLCASAAVHLPAQERDPADVLILRELAEWIAMPETLMYRLKSREQGFVVVDLRLREQYERGHIRGALNYPWTTGSFGSSFLALPEDSDLFLVSGDGGYALEAVRLLLTAGYTRVFAVEGGMLNWPYDDLLERGS